MIVTRWARVPPFGRGITLGDFLVPIRVGERASSWQRHVLMIAVGTLLIVLGARISFYLPGNPLVPVTLQTCGYLIGFLLAGGLVGRLAELGWDRRIGGSVAAMLLGNLVIYVVGVPWLMA